MFDLVTIGDSVMDIFIILDDSDSNCILKKKEQKLCFNYADKICINDSTHSIGGNAANVAIGAETLGLNTAIVTEIGDDLNGQAVLHEFSERGVDTRFAKVHKNKETRYSVVLNYQTERTILSYHVGRKYTLPRLPQTKWVYFTSMGAGFEKVQNALEKHLKKHGQTRLAMNPGSYQLKNGMKKIKSLLPRCEVFLVNKEEAARILGKKGSIKQLAKGLHKLGAQTVVITDSMAGSYASDGKQMWHMKTYPLKPVAKTGAGDAYTSGFLSALISGKDIPEAMQWGTANAGSVVQKFGAQHGLATERKIKKIIKTYSNAIPTRY